MRFIYFLGIVTGIFSCQTDTTNSNDWGYIEKSVQEEACLLGDCAKVDFAFPYFEGEGDSIEILNKHIEEQIVKFLNVGERQDILPLDSAVSNFLNSFLDFKKNYDRPQEWEIAVQAAVTFEDASLITIVFENFSFTGGAHPNSYRFYLNFEKRLKQPLANAQLILDAPALLLLAEKKFREHHDVEAGIPLSEDGRFFLENETDFFLPVAMGFEGHEVVLYFQPYEIAAYVMGGTELRFEKDELKGVLKFVD